MVDPASIIRELNRAQVDYLVIGGIAATLHGCPEQTYDLDILYASTAENRTRLLVALKAMNAEWEQPLTEILLQRQHVFALNTRFGDLDIFSHAPALENYSAAFAEASQVELDRQPVKILNLSRLIAAKEAAADPNPRKQSALAFLKELKKAQR